MTQIRTIDGERHNVKETLDEINKLMEDRRVLETGIIHLNWQVTITSWEKGEEANKRQYEPVSFICENIMMYY